MSQQHTPSQVGSSSDRATLTSSLIAGKIFAGVSSAEEPWTATSCHLLTHVLIEIAENDMIDVVQLPGVKRLEGVLREHEL